MATSFLSRTLLLGSQLSSPPAPSAAGAVVPLSLAITGTLAASTGSISGGLTIGGVLQNGATGFLSQRGYDENPAFGAATGVAGSALPGPFMGLPGFVGRTASLAAPVPGTYTTNYSQRISGYVLPPATGTYTFRVGFKDGARLWLGNTKLLDSWTFQSAASTLTSAPLIITGSTWVPLTLEHAAATTPALNVQWGTASGTWVSMAHGAGNFSFYSDGTERGLLGTTYVAGQLVCGDYLQTPNGRFSGKTSELLNDAGYFTTGSGMNVVSGGLLGRVFDESAGYAAATPTAGTALPAPFLTLPVASTQLTSLDATNGSWGTLTGAYSLMVRGYVAPAATGSYTFRLTYEDGVRFYLGPTKLVDSWTFLAAPGTVTTSSLYVTAGTWMPLILEHAAGTGGNRLKLEYSLNGGGYGLLTSPAFALAYNAQEYTPPVSGTSYISGQLVCSDYVLLPNARFSGKSSELLNDAGFLAANATTITSFAAATITGTVLSVTGAYASVTGNFRVGGTTTVAALTATSVAGDGSALTGLNASNVASGTLNNSRLPSSISVSNVTTTGLTVSGLITNSSYPAYITPTLLNGWSVGGAGSVAPGYILDTYTGRVYIKGTVVGGTLNAAIFVLPVGYRPGGGTAGGSYAVDAGLAFGRLVIDPNGTVRLSSGSTSFVNIEGVSFSVY